MGPNTNNYNMYPQLHTRTRVISFSQKHTHTWAHLDIRSREKWQKSYTPMKSNAIISFVGDINIYSIPFMNTNHRSRKEAIHRQDALSDAQSSHNDFLQLRNHQGSARGHRFYSMNAERKLLHSNLFINLIAS